VGLIQRVIEEQGITTVGVTIVRDYTEKVKPPRSVFLRWPFGHPFGEPFHHSQQRTVLQELFKAVETIDRAGTIIDLPFRWKRETYSDR